MQRESLLSLQKFFKKPNMVISENETVGCLIKSNQHHRPYLTS